MPQVNIEGVGKVNFPDEMSQEQIVAAIENDILPRMKKPERAPEYTNEPSAWERFGRGASDIVDRGAQLLAKGGETLGLDAFPEGLSDIVTQRANAERGQYEGERQAAAKRSGKKDAGFDWMRIAGNTAIQSPTMMLPGGGKATMGRAGAGALQGFISGLSQFDPTNSAAGSAKNAGIGAAAGAILSPIVGKVADKVGQGLSWLTGRGKGALARVHGDASEEAILQAVPDLSNATPEVRTDLIREAQEQIAATGELDAAALARKANLLAQGVTPTKSMVTRSARDWTQERNLQKLSQSPDEQLSQVGENLTRVYEGNDRALTGKLMERSQGLPQASAEAHGMTVMRSLDDLATATQKEVGAVYDQVRQSVGDQAATRADKVVDVLNDPDIVDNVDSEPLIKSVTARLKRYGIIDADGNLSGKMLTVNQSEEFRKFVGGLGGTANTSRIAKKFVRAIDEDVTASLSGDAFAAARGAARDRFAMLENPATQRALNTLGELGQGKTAQNFIDQQVVKAPIQDVATLIDTVKRLPPDEAAKALDAMKAGILQHLRDEAINPNSGQLSGASLNKALESIGPEKLAAILGQDEAGKLANLARAALDATYAPPFSAVNNSNTTPMLLSLLRGARTIPAMPMLITDNAEKIAARAGYQKQLTEALAAKAPGALPDYNLNPMGRLLAALGIPASNAALNQHRKTPDQRAK